MSGKKQHRRYSLDEIQDYLNNRMSEGDSNTFEREMQRDPFLADAVEGFSRVSGEEAYEDIASVHSRILQNKNSGRKLLIYRYAASIAVLALLSVTYYTVFLSKTKIIPAEVIVTDTKTPADSDFPVTEPQKGETSQTETLSPVIAREKTIPVTAGSGKKSVAQEEVMKEEGIKEEARVDDLIADEEKELILEALKELDEEEPVEYEIPENAEGTNYLAGKNDDIQYRMASESSKKMLALPASAPHSNGERVESKLLQGIVISAEDNQPVYGAIIYLKGSEKGVLTDLNGKFEINTSTESNVNLIAYYIGLERKEIEVNYRDGIRIVLSPEPFENGDIVIMGYGIKKEEENAGIVTIPFDNSTPVGYTPAAPAIGEEGFKEYIKNNQKFPENTGFTQAVVVLNFIVRVDGKLNNISEVESTAQPFYNEVLRLLKEGPSWVPAAADGKNKEEAVRLRILFRK